MDGCKSTKSFKILSDHGYSLHVEESGESSGIPLLFLHGGPGAGIGQNYQWPFSSSKYRVIAFDQRGCGKSQPFGSLKHNTTQDLINDIEILRQYFNIDKWVLFGGSWGSTLALTYAISHPERVMAMVLRGIFLARPGDTDWFISPEQGASQVFPEEYKRFTQGYTNTEKSLCEWFFEALTSNKESTRIRAAKSWFDWEGSISKLQTQQQLFSDGASIQQIYTLALYECYYILNNCFIAPNYILDNCDKIKDIPCHIVHGRYDMVCKCEAAISLHNALDNSTLNIVENAGHSMTEDGIAKGLVEALNELSSLFAVSSNIGLLAK